LTFLKHIKILTVSPSISMVSVECWTTFARKCNNDCKVSLFDIGSRATRYCKADSRCSCADISVNKWERKKHLLIGSCCFLIYIIYRISTAMKVETAIIASITESDNVQCTCVSRDMQNFYPNIIIFDVTLANNFQHQNVCWYWKYSWLRSKEYIYIYSLPWNHILLFYFHFSSSLICIGMCFNALFHSLLYSTIDRKSR
jgi:hypothetical protein